MKLLVAALIILTFAWGIKARATEIVRIAGTNQFFVRNTTTEAQEQQRIRAFGANGVMPYMPYFMFQATSERDYMRQFHREFPMAPNHRNRSFIWAQRAADHLATNFVDMLSLGFEECGLYNTLTPAQQLFFLRDGHAPLNFQDTMIMSVPFRLCANDQSTCSMEESFIAKNYPRENVILVDALKWNLITDEYRAQIAVHETLGLLGIEEASYGISSRVHVQYVQRVVSQVGDRATLHVGWECRLSP